MYVLIHRNYQFGITMHIGTDRSPMPEFICTSDTSEITKAGKRLYIPGFEGRLTPNLYKYEIQTKSP